MWKKHILAMHSLYFKATLELWLHTYLSKMRGFPQFLSVPKGLAKICFFPIAVTFAKIPLYQRLTIL